MQLRLQKFKIRGVLLLLMLIASSRLMALDVQLLFEKGLKAYQEKDYEAAVNAYEKALSGELKSAEAYNNLGLAYYKMSDIGRAALNFERALRQQPRHKDARHNLKACQQYLDVSVQQSNSFWLFRAWTGLVVSLSSFSWSLLFWFCLILATAAAAYWYNSKDQKIKRKALTATVVLVLCSFLPLLLGFQAAHREHDSNAVIIIAKEAGIRTAPEINGEDILVVSAGVKARIVEEKENWNRIRFANGVLGWMPSKMMERI